MRRLVGLLLIGFVGVGVCVLATPPVGMGSAAGARSHAAPRRPLARAPQRPLARPPRTLPARKVGPRLSAKPKLPTASINQTFVVDTSGDPTTGTSCAPGHPAGTCSLRAAVAAADADTGHVDAIKVPSGTQVLLTQMTPLDLTNSMVIKGTGASVSGDGAQVFNQSGSPAVKITGLTITGANTDGNGGGVYCSGGTLFFVDVKIVGNTASNGGGAYIDTACQMWMDKSVVQGNTATGSAPGASPDGGGLYTWGSAYIERSTIGDPTGKAPNEAADGAGLFNLAGDIIVTDSAIDGNMRSPSSEFCSGVGIFNNAVLDLSDSTVDYNAAPGGCDGVGVYTQHTAQIKDTQISHNKASGTSAAQGTGIDASGYSTSLTDVSLIGNRSNVTAGASVTGGALLTYADRFSYNGGVVRDTSNRSRGQGGSIEGGALSINASQATLSNLRISKTRNLASPAQGIEGGALYNDANLNLTGVSVSGTSNRGQYVKGGALYNEADSTLTDFTASSTSNHGSYSGGGNIEGGAIYNDDSASISGSALTGTTDIADLGSAPTPSTTPTYVYGGALYTDEMSTVDGLSIKNTTVTAAGGSGYIYGGGIYNAAELNARDIQVVKASVVADWYIEGGLVDNYAPLNATNLTLGDATVTALGGPDASSPFVDGAIMYNAAPANIVNGTLDDVSSHVPAGGLFLYGIDNDGPLQLTNATIAKDRVSGPSGHSFLLYASGYQVGLRNSVVSSTIPARNCGTAGSSSVIVSAGHNLDSGTSCGFTNTGDKDKTWPKIMPLANNGGLVQTGALERSSPAIKAATRCPPTDARGVARPAAVCDAGAYELTPAKKTATAVGGTGANPAARRP